MANKAFKVKHGLELPSGTAVSEFSIDSTLTGNSDDAVPTEKAVKGYVDDNTTTAAAALNDAVAMAIALG
jgi:hypothetical protein